MKEIKCLNLEKYSKMQEFEETKMLDKSKKKEKSMQVIIHYPE